MSRQVKPLLDQNGLALYSVNFTTVFESGSVPGDCNSIVFMNKGTSTVVIGGGLILAPEQSFAMDGNLFEWDATNYTINFDTANGTLNQLVVARKVYQSIS